MKIGADIKRKLKELFPYGGRWESSTRPLSFKEDGTFIIRKTYFYHHGLTLDLFGKMVSNVLKVAEIDAILVGSGDEWNPWPKDSFFWVQYRLVDKE